MNSPLQSLAALDVRLAMWRLMRAGYQVAIMIHDEIVCEVPDDGNQENARREIEQIMVDAMEEFTRGIPVRCESMILRSWGNG